jgi:hypothetical protein
MPYLTDIGPSEIVNIVGEVAMKTMELKTRLSLKNILYASDFSPVAENAARMHWSSRVATGVKCLRCMSARLRYMGWHRPNRGPF